MISNVRFAFLLLLQLACMSAWAQVPVSPSTTAPLDTNPILIDSVELEIVDSTGEEIIDTNIVHANAIDYRKIAILGSFLLDENTKGYSQSMSEKAKLSLFFYEGVRLALDSLSRLGLYADITVLDNKADGSNLSELFAMEGLQKSEIIIGPIYNPIIRAVDGYSKLYKLPMVSPLSPTPNLVTGNPLYVQINPTIESLAEKILERCIQLQSNGKIYIVNSADEEENRRKLIFQDLVKAYNTKNKANLELISLDLAADWSASFDSINENILIVNSFKENYAKSVHEKFKLMNPNTRYMVYGMPSWKDFGSLKDLFPNKRVMTTVPQYLDRNSYCYTSLVRKFKKSNGLIPNETIFKGFDIMMYYGLRMLNYGKDFFSKSLTEPYEGVVIKIHPMPVYAANSTTEINYYENKSCYNLEWDIYSKKWRVVY